MFGRGIQAPEIILILLVIVLLFGAKKLPDLARSIGRSARELRSGLMNPSSGPEDSEVDETRQSTTGQGAK